MSSLLTDERSQVLDAAVTPWAGLTWNLCCPWCKGRVPAKWFLHDASAHLARHAVESHPWELQVLEIHVGAWRGERHAE